MRIFLFISAILIALFFAQKMATYATGLFVYVPYLAIFAVVVFLIVNYQKVIKWLGAGLFFVGFVSSCNFIESDKIGVRVENFGKTKDDYHIVYGKFPQDWSQSSWNLTYPGQSFGIGVDPFIVSSKDGVTFDCDPSVLVSLIREDQACQKYAFKFSAYKNEEAFKGAIQQVILKECLDAVRFTIGSAVSDSILFNRTKFESIIQSKFAKSLTDVYGVNLDQFSLTLNPPAELQSAINDRLLAQEKTKKTLASLANAEAEVQLAEVERKKMLVQTAGYTDAYLKNKALDVYYALSQSNNKVFIVGDAKQILIKD